MLVSLVVMWAGEGNRGRPDRKEAESAAAAGVLILEEVWRAMVAMGRAGPALSL